MNLLLLILRIFFPSLSARRKSLQPVRVVAEGSRGMTPPSMDERSLITAWHGWLTLRSGIYDPDPTTYALWDDRNQIDFPDNVDRSRGQSRLRKYRE